MRDSIAAYLEHCSSLRYSQATLETYERRLMQFRRFALDHEVKQIRNITITLVRAFQDGLICRNVQPSSIKAYMVTVSGYLKWCYEHRLVLSDLSSRIELPKKPMTLPPQPLTEEDIEKLFRSIPASGLQNLRNRALLEILYACGLRKQEAIDINIGDVDFNKGIVHVRGKGDKQRLVPIHDRALKAISDYLMARGGKPNRNSPLLVTHSNRCKEPHRMTGVGLGKIFLKLNKRFHKHLHPHLLRHTFALHMLKNGVDLRHIQLLLGHESIDTSSAYLGFCKEEIKREYDRGIDWILSQD